MTPPRDISVSRLQTASVEAEERRRVQIGDRGLLPGRYPNSVASANDGATVAITAVERSCRPTM
jgi:hypothetical protein